MTSLFETHREGGLVTEDALDETGYVMMFGTAAEKVKKAAGAASDVIMGFNEIDSKDVDGTAQANVAITVTKLRRGMLADLQLELAATRTTDIVYGSELVVSDAEPGKVCHATDSANGKRIGYAREAVDAATDPSDNRIMVEVNAE